MGSIRGGWVGYIRAHGVDVEPPEGLDLNVRLGGTVEPLVDDARLRVEVALVLPINYPTQNWFGVEGDASPSSRNATLLRPEDPRGSWLQVLVTRQYELEDALLQEFVASEGKSVASVEAALGAAIDRELFDVGLLASGLVGLTVERQHPELRRTGHAYWWSGDKYAQVANIAVSRIVVPCVVFNEQRANEVMNAAAPALVHIAGAQDDNRRALTLALEWFLSLGDLPIGSNERFVVYFQMMEALVQCADGHAEPDLVESYQLLEDLTGQYAGSNTTKLRELLNVMKGRTLRPSLRLRFTRLAHARSADSAHADIAAFDDMNELRNELVHARRTKVPATWRDRNVEDTMRYLSVHYTKLVAQRLAASLHVTAPPGS